MRRFLFLVILLFSMGGLSFAQTCGAGYLRMNVRTISKSMFTGSLTNYPALIPYNGVTPAGSITFNDFKTAANSGLIQHTDVDAKGYLVPADYVLCTAATGGSKIKFAVINYVASSGMGAVYLKSQPTTTADIVVYEFYDNPSVTTYQGDLSVFTDANYALYCDMSDLTKDCRVGGTATNHGATTTTGALGTGATFASASSQWFDSGTIQNLTNFSVMFFGNNPGQAFNALLSNAPAGQNGGVIVLYESSLNQWECAYRNGGGLTRKRVSSPTANLDFVICTHTAGSANLTLYLGGTSVGSITDSGATDPSNTAAPFVFGRDGAASAGYWNAKGDEFIVTTDVKTQDWATAANRNYTNAAAYISGYPVDVRTPAGLSSGAYCIPLTIDHTKIPNTDQSDFPLLVIGQYGWMATVPNGGFAVNGNSAHDIRWYSDSGCTSAIAFQRIFWDATGYSAFRVRVATASHTTDPVVYVKIGASGDTSDLSTNWMGSYHYIGVYNGGSPSSLSADDSGSAGLTLTCGVDVSAATTPVGGGFYFGNTGTDTAVCTWGPSGSDTLGAHGYPIGSAVGHVRLAFKFDGNTLNRCDLYGNDCFVGGYGKSNGDGQRALGFNHRATQSTGLPVTNFETGGPSITIANTGTTPTWTMDNNWHWVEFDYPTAAGALTTSKVCFDGVCASSPNYVSSSTVLNTDNHTGASGVAPEICLGRACAHGNYRYTGLAAQFEVSDVSRSEDMIKARFNNESDPVGFYSLGTGSSVSPGSSGRKGRQGRLY
jgi:hypothetical protein